METFWITVALNCIVHYNVHVADAASTLIACEGEYIPLECAAGLSIHILDANFGRTEVAPCGGNTSSLTSCTMQGSLDIVKGICEASNTCSILSSSTVFSDPCPGVTKYLVVTFECLGGPTADTVQTTDVITTEELLTTTSIPEKTTTYISQRLTDPLLDQTTSQCTCTETTRNPYTNQLSLADLTANPEIVQEITKNITAELKIDKKTLSSAKRRITSAPDNRVSATFVGYLGIVVLTVVFGLIVITDIVNIVIPCILGQRSVLYDRNS